MVEESIYTRLAEASKLLAEVDKLADSGIRVVVCALNGCLGAQDIAKQGRVTHFLVSHKLNQEPITRGKPSGFEFGNGKTGKAIVEEIQFDPLLVKSQSLTIR